MPRKMSERKPLLGVEPDRGWHWIDVRDFYEDLITSGRLRVVEDPKDTHFKTQQKSLEILRDGGKQFALYIGDMMHSKLFDKDGLEHPIFSFHAGFPVHELRVVEGVEVVLMDGSSVMGRCNGCGIATLKQHTYCPGCGSKISRQ